MTEGQHGCLNGEDAWTRKKTERRGAHRRHRSGSLESDKGPLPLAGVDQWYRTRSASEAYGEMKLDGQLGAAQVGEQGPTGPLLAFVSVSSTPHHLTAHQSTPSPVLEIPPAARSPIILASFVKPIPSLLSIASTLWQDQTLRHHGLLQLLPRSHQLQSSRWRERDLNLWIRPVSSPGRHGSNSLNSLSRNAFRLPRPTAVHQVFPGPHVDWMCELIPSERLGGKADRRLAAGDGGRGVGHVVLAAIAGVDPRFHRYCIRILAHYKPFVVVYFVVQYFMVSGRDANEAKHPR